MRGRLRIANHVIDSYVSSGEVGRYKLGQVTTLFDAIEIATGWLKTTSVLNFGAPREDEDDDIINLLFWQFDILAPRCIVRNARIFSYTILKGLFIICLWEV